MPTENILIDGAAGAIDTIVDIPADIRGIGLVGHPHPLFGGANTNKVAWTLSRTLNGHGYVALRPNFRGVGQSTGEHDFGVGETDDMLQVLRYAQQRFGADLPVILSGFSFGSYVQTRLAEQLASAGTPAQRLVLVGTATGEVSDGDRHYATGNVPANTIVIHGESDATVPLHNVLNWARPQSLPVIVLPGADHFFHGQLNLLRDVISKNIP